MAINAPKNTCRDKPKEMPRVLHTELVLVEIERPFIFEVVSVITCRKWSM
jgi:hypothetical protein